MKGRKKEHLEIVLKENVMHSYNYWDDFILLHNALPEVDMDEIDLSVEIFGKRLSSPIIIAGMTGGFKEAKVINEKLAEKEEIIVGNKIDIETARENIKILKENFKEVYFISSLTGEGIKELEEVIWNKLERKI